ncbi:HEPN domain-containing protein [Acinetobacter sp. RW6]|uniref:HEPN domain-containing protein n=1 Tax=Acinetobacter sp. RW6 TaxID=3242680 RepID=UPI0035BFC1B2
MDSIEFLNFSKKIMSTNPIGEIDYRQVVGRSYYCAFHQVKDKVIKLGVPVDAYRGPTHTSLVTTLREFPTSNKQLKGLAFKINDFHSRRVIADYKLDKQVSEVMANEAIKTCEGILNDISKITSL